MHILYIDESGDPHGWKNQRHFVLGAVAVHEGQIHKYTVLMDGLQRKYFPTINIPIALHATDIHEAKGHFDHLPPEKREQLMMDICNIIGRSRFPHLIAFATAIHISALTTEREAIEKALEDLTSRFNILMKRLYSKALPGKGLLIIDQSHQERYRELIAEYQSVGSKYGLMRNIVDIPYFAGARDTRMLQLADMCAYSVFRNYERNDTRYFSKILPCFDRITPTSGPDGLKHYINDPCECIACKWHRR